MTTTAIDHGIGQLRRFQRLVAGRASWWCRRHRSSRRSPCGPRGSPAPARRSRWRRTATSRPRRCSSFELPLEAGVVAREPALLDVVVEAEERHPVRRIALRQQRVQELRRRSRFRTSGPWRSSRWCPPAGRPRAAGRSAARRPRSPAARRCRRSRNRPCCRVPTSSPAWFLTVAMTWTRLTFDPDRRLLRARRQRRQQRAEATLTSHRNITVPLSFHPDLAIHEVLLLPDRARVFFSRLMPSSAASNAARRCGAVTITATLVSPISMRPSRCTMAMCVTSCDAAISPPIWAIILSAIDS